MQLNAFLQALDDLLQPAKFNDYCPNGLQVEGRAEVRTLVTGVTASEALIDAAIALKADAILFITVISGRVSGPKSSA